MTSSLSNRVPTESAVETLNIKNKYTSHENVIAFALVPGASMCSRRRRSTPCHVQVYVSIHIILLYRLLYIYLGLNVCIGLWVSRKKERDLRIWNSYYNLILPTSVHSHSFYLALLSLSLISPLFLILRLFIFGFSKEASPFRTAAHPNGGAARGTHSTQPIGNSWKSYSKIVHADISNIYRPSVNLTVYRPQLQTLICIREWKRHQIFRRSSNFPLFLFDLSDWFSPLGTIIDYCSTRQQSAVLLTQPKALPDFNMPVYIRILSFMLYIIYIFKEQ